MTEAPVIAGRYRAVALVANTATSRVIRARDATDDSDVVVKIAAATSPFRTPGSPLFAANELFFGPRSPADLVEHEARVLARLRHRGVAQLLDDGTHQGLPFVVTRFAEGTRLDEMREERWSAAQVEELARAMLDVLDHVHSNGVVHRDLKPSNILAHERGGALALTLVDFELATIDGNGVAGLVGSSIYRAPELTAAVEPSLVVCDQRVDLYALGVVLYEMLVGRPPFPDRSTCTRAHAADIPESVGERPGVPPGLARLIDVLLAKEPGDRPNSAPLALHDVMATPPPVTSWIAKAKLPAPRVPAKNHELLRCGWTSEHLAALTPARRKAVREAFEQLHRARLVARDSPTHAPSLLQVARLSGEAGRLGIALDAAQAACRLEPQSVDAHLQRGEIEARLGAWPQAAACYAEALRLAPDRAEAWAGRALTLARTGEPNAEDALANAVDSPLSWRWHARLAAAAVELGLPGLAVAAALSADEADPGASVLPRIAGQLILMSGSRPNDPETVLPLAVACVQLAVRSERSERPEAARAHFAQAVDLARRGLASSPQPPDPRVLLHAALAERESGDDAMADRLFEAANIVGLAESIADHIGFAAPLSECPSPQLLRLLAVSAAGQWRLARSLLGLSPLEDAEQ